MWATQKEKSEVVDVDNPGALKEMSWGKERDAPGSM
jgi:hypothetical protein